MSCKLRTRKRALVYEMVETVSAEVGMPEPTGDWRGRHAVAAGSSANLAQPAPGAGQACRTAATRPATLASSSSGWRLEPGDRGARPIVKIAMINGFGLDAVRAELAGVPILRARPGSSAAAWNCVATGRYPRSRGDRQWTANGGRSTGGPLRNDDRQDPDGCRGGTGKRQWRQDSRYARCLDLGGQAVGARGGGRPSAPGLTSGARAATAATGP